jgi:N-acyl-L-homoserine lactone synthetase
MRTHIITPQNRSRYAHIVSAMFRQRAAVFVDRLGWQNMTVIDGEERDEADRDPDVEYIVTLDANGELVGSLRLTCTTGGCLLNGPLSNYLEKPLLQMPTDWEMTRLTSSTDADDPRSSKSFAYLAVGTQEWAAQRGVKKIYGIGEASMVGLIGGLGLDVSLEGPPVEYEAGKTAFAFSLPIGPESLASVRSAMRIQTSVLGHLDNQDGIAA